MRDTIIALLKEVRPNIDLRAGSPMYIYLVDALASIAGKLIDDIEKGRTLDVVDTAGMFFIEEGTSVNSECTLRLYFWSAENLSYSAGQLTIMSRSGATYTNKYPVSIRASAMALYTDDVYFYHDITITGTSPISSASELIWDDAPDSLSHVVITSIVNPGSLGLSSSDLAVRISREIALRNNISSPGIVAFLSNMFTTQLKDVLVQGYLDPEMKRDIIDNLHIGGCVDVYVKGFYPENKSLRFDNEELKREATFEETMVESPYHLTHRGLITCTASTCNRASLNTGLPDLSLTSSHFSVDMETGVVAILNQNIQDVTQVLSGTVNLTSVSGKYFLVNLGSTDIVLNGSIILYDSEYYLVKEKDTTSFSGNIAYRVDRDIEVQSIPTLTMQVFEPIRLTYTYRPIGVELSLFDNPVIAMDEVNVVDPLTDDDIVDTINRLPGFGSGVYGLGPYGRGTGTGWETRIDDENLRYSVYEKGFIELPRDTFLERIGIEYKMDPFVSIAQAALSANRPKTVNIIAFAFVPCHVNMSLRIEETNVDLTSIRYLIWEMPGEMELSDLNAALYQIGVKKLMWSDFYDTSTYEIWKRDGTFMTVVPDADGIITLSNLSERFLPLSLMIRAS